MRIFESIIFAFDLLLQGQVGSSYYTYISLIIGHMAWERENSL